MVRRLVLACALAGLLGSTLLTPAVQAAPYTLKCTKTTVAPKTPAQYTLPKASLKKTTYTVTMRTNCGSIVIKADAKRAPVTVSALSFLAGKKYFNNTYCHRLTTEGIFILQCGDPSASGSGGPGFQYKDENLPTTKKANRYPVGTVAMANAGAGTNGSQFFLVYRAGTYDLPPNYTIWGHITSGLDILNAIGAKGVGDGSADGSPAQAVLVKSITVSEGTP